MNSFKVQSGLFSQATHPAGTAARLFDLSEGLELVTTGYGDVRGWHIWLLGGDQTVWKGCVRLSMATSQDGTSVNRTGMSLQISC